MISHTRERKKSAAALNTIKSSLINPICLNPITVGIKQTAAHDVGVAVWFHTGLDLLHRPIHLGLHYEFMFTFRYAEMHKSTMIIPKSAHGRFYVCRSRTGYREEPSEASVIGTTKVWRGAPKCWWKDKEVKGNAQQLQNQGICKLEDGRSWSAEAPRLHKSV